MSDWTKPKVIENPNPFGVPDVNEYLPAEGEIPKEFWGWHANEWVKIVEEWFFCGLRNAKFYPKDGIDAEAAYNHLGACMSSWQPKHEHKTAGVAYLLSLWFDKVEYDKT